MKNFRRWLRSVRKKACLALGLCAPLWSCAQIQGSDRAVLARSSEFVVVVAEPGDTPESLATAFLGDASQDWIITEFNDLDRVRTGQQLIIPLLPINAARIFPGGYQTVPILSYHRFRRGNKSHDRLEVSAEAFSQQMSYLRDHGYRIVHLWEIASFLARKAPLPRKSVVLTFDDGYNSVFEVAYPILRKFSFKGTVFLYTDLVGSAAGLTWAELEEMVVSGLIDVQPHSKTHSDLTVMAQGEDSAGYERRIREEIRYPARKIAEQLDLRIHTFAYPYGAVNDTLVTILEAESYQMGVTVIRGGNPSFAHPYLLRRTMIYRDDDIESFARRLEVFRGVEP